MISLTRLDGRVFALNADLIECIEGDPDRSGAVVTLVDGASYAVVETVVDVMTAVHTMRAALLAMSGRISATGVAPTLRSVPNPVDA